MHYSVDREKLRLLASEIEGLAAIQTETYNSEIKEFEQSKKDNCHLHNQKYPWGGMKKL